ncbi:transglycosylase SLT domain-containing protein [Ramlibacter pallidus]|uniref:Lytic transglycosylase domain-containing protein n=1 Tax=Ramlibacter pallidus TaxID=2780087 RepID=A0ABR9S995_9BURK|nr:transglycosylase SLT domain-containing protein [Ramlibacter pallidus]MBE7370107.1 lytic transglycosylase domain-containing protein [Ramlibacter pallidus]
MKERLASQVTSVHNVLMLAGMLGVGLTGSMGTTPAPTSDTLAQRVQAGKVAEVAAQIAGLELKVPKIAFGTPTPASPLGFKHDHYEQLRSQMRWLPVRYAGTVLKTPDPTSRILLAQSAAEKAGLQEVGLSYHDVYGIINAETSWIPRMGSSKDGTPNLGIAQFEPATAKAVGLTDPLDPVQAVHAAALHLKDAARWSARRIAGLKLTPEQHAQKLREGVSIYYNLSTKGRNTWNGMNTAKLPVETRRHIANARVGAREAAELEAQLAQLKRRMNQPGVMTVSLPDSGS